MPPAFKKTYRTAFEYIAKGLCCSLNVAILLSGVVAVVILGGVSAGLAAVAAGISFVLPAVCTVSGQYYGTKKAREHHKQQPLGRAFASNESPSYTSTAPCKISQAMASTDGLPSNASVGTSAMQPADNHPLLRQATTLLYQPI